MARTSRTVDKHNLHNNIEQNFCQQDLKAVIDTKVVSANSRRRVSRDTSDPNQFRYINRDSDKSWKKRTVQNDHINANNPQTPEYTSKLISNHKLFDPANNHQKGNISLIRLDAKSFTVAFTCPQLYD